MKQDKITLIVKQSILYAALLLFISFSSGCKKSPTENPKPEPGEPELSENARVNQWVTENMRIYYYWNESIPQDNNLNVELGPREFFKTILNKDDRFSWIDKADALKDDLSGVSTSIGMNIGLVQGAGDAVFGYVRYVIPKGPADMAGVERGMFISKVNGREMTMNNYESVLAPYFNGENLKLQLGERVGDTVKATKEVDLIAIKVAEPSVYMHKVLTTNSGRKVGYLFYNRFLNEKSQELLDAFQDFKAQGVQDLILDLRYNLGGGIAVSGLLSALIMEGYEEDKVFVEYNYNKDLNAQFDAMHQADPVENPSRAMQFRDLFASAWLSKVKPTNLNLNKVYVLATYNSASASELVINNLRPYINVVHIGDTTRGKNEGSITIEDERTPKTIDWAIQPIVLKLANAQHFGDYANGLVPTQLVEEGVNLKPLGDAEDPLVKAALEQIDPSMMARARATPERVLSMLRGIQKFDEIHNKARPVLVDGTVNRNLLRKMKD